MHSYLLVLLSIFVGCLGHETTSNMTFVPNMESSIMTNVDISSDKRILLSKGVALVLECQLSGCAECPVSWVKDKKALNESNSYYTLSNYSLVIQKPDLKRDVGDYTCVLHAKDNEVNTTISVVTEPIIIPFPGSKNIVQGEPLTLHCQIYGGSPLPKITWFKAESPINVSDKRVALKKDEDRGIEDAILTIDEVDYDDRSFYSCFANNGVGNGTSAKVMVRVKDKLAALWPFLGICGEVAILCTIIFVYERKKSKNEFEEAEADHTDNKLTGSQKDKGQQEVRQRK